MKLSGVRNGTKKYWQKYMQIKCKERKSLPKINKYSISLYFYKIAFLNIRILLYISLRNMSQKCVHESLLLISSSRYACVVVLWGQGPKVVSNLYLRPSLCVCVNLFWVFLLIPKTFAK